MTMLAVAVIPYSDVSMLAKDVAAVIFHIFTPFTTRRISFVSYHYLGSSQ